jgi:hypothetical protein
MMDLDELESRIDRANRAVTSVKALLVQEAIDRAQRDGLSDPMRIASAIARSWEEREVLEAAVAQHGWLGLAAEWLRWRRQSEIAPPRP